MFVLLDLSFLASQSFNRTKAQQKGKESNDLKVVEVVSLTSFLKGNCIKFRAHLSTRKSQQRLSFFQNKQP
jgi:hypothetical protein